MVKLLLRGGLLCLVLALAPGPAPALDLEPFREADPASAVRIDHDPWGDFLLRYLRIGPGGVHRIRYGDVTIDDRARLGRYVDGLASVDFGRLSRREQVALWLNLYNAVVVRLVVDHYPVGRFTDIGPSGPFALPLVEVAGQALSLADIAERILLPIYDDSRLVYGLSCGAIGCPNLQVEPFLPHKLDAQLNDAAMAFVNDSRCVRIEDSDLVLSSLYQWHPEAFGGSDRAIIRHLMAFAEPQLAKELQDFERVAGHVFDWRLNDATLM